MRLDVSQQLRLTQQMKLSPRIIQAMEILQLPMLALQERIDAEMMSNPVLEMQELETDEPTASDDTEAVDRGETDLVIEDSPNAQGDDFERLSEFTAEYGMEFITSEAPPRPKAPTGERDRKLDAMANAPAHAQSLTEHLHDQWRFIEVDDALAAAGRLIIDEIDADGYCRTPLEQIAARGDTPVDMPCFHKALRLVQKLEPVGVGARDLKECLLIQLAAEADAGREVTIELTLVQRHLHDIEMNRLPQIERRSGFTIEQIKRAIANLSHLNPRPGSLIGSRVVPIIMPDVIVDVDEDGNLYVAMPDGNAPRLGISDDYRRIARDRKTGREAKQFLRNNIRSAQWLVGAIAQRRNTVRRVAEEVFNVQRDFLEHGDRALKPLPMATVADRVGVHVATVSRAVSGKYAQTPRGIFPLRMFFSGGTTRADGQDMAWDAVKAKLQDIVDGEDKSKPLNDDQLAGALSEAGLTIARRTVAKYRGLLDIPPARRRREF